MWGLSCRRTFKAELPVPRPQKGPLKHSTVPETGALWWHLQGGRRKRL